MYFIRSAPRVGRIYTKSIIVQDKPEIEIERYFVKNPN
jgi:hypothetical protein